MSNQLVILCGGRGTRLMPITRNIPKPMALVNDIPFLEYLLRQAKNKGIKDFLLLTGYLGEKIEGYFEDGKKLGVNIQYDHGAEELDTAERLRKASEKIEENFYLLYGDNYVEVDINTVRQKMGISKTDLCMVIQPKKPGNVDVIGDIGIYHDQRGEANEWVEVGYMSIKKTPMIKAMEMENMKSLKEYLVYASKNKECQ